MSVNKTENHRTRMTQIIQDHEFLANNLKSVHYENCMKLPESLFTYFWHRFLVYPKLADFFG